MARFGDRERSFVILLFRLSFFAPPFPLPLLSTKELLCRHGDDRAAPKINLEYYAHLLRLMLLKHGMSTMYHQQPVLVGIMPDTCGIVADT
uniref:Uncharacterized protein n=2 Tax=Oryza sativa subsp. japonica TaxID=39947 RepID=H2KW16_ORYSJ|nr:hypothetical protein [Oryza sativa Japonica Group]ABG22452.1 hypothetical protein LOC_Os11g18382 [Oryza sativa Japonica Group]